MTKGSAWAGLGLASIITCLHAMPARAVWVDTSATEDCAPAEPAAPASSEPDSLPVASSPATPVDELAPALPADGDAVIVEILLEDPPAPEWLAASGRTCCFYRGGADSTTCREKTCVPVGQPCPPEVHGCPFSQAFIVNSCGACR